MNSSSNSARIRRALTVIVLSAACAGCYLWESAEGQLALLSRREPIQKVLADPALPAGLRRQLEAASSIRDFASRELGLPDNGSYRSYADVGRRYVVWNVVAAPEFSVDAKAWCYPIVGCVSYRGYFREGRAQAFAAKLKAAGFDVSVGGVAAYSTLGHFDDPILNTMVDWNDVELAGIIFHELTHQWLYVAGDASFNEALATTIEEEGVRRWLLSQGRVEELERHVVEEGHYAQVVGILTDTRDELRIVYGSQVDADDLRRRKAAAFGALRARYAELAASWGGRAPFGAWFRDGLNNAHLASIATYTECVPGFRRELEAVGGDLAAFYRRVRVLAKLERAQRDASVCRR